MRRFLSNYFDLLFCTDFSRNLDDRHLWLTIVVVERSMIKDWGERLIWKVAPSSLTSGWWKREKEDCCRCRCQARSRDCCCDAVTLGTRWLRWVARWVLRYVGHWLTKPLPSAGVLALMQQFCVAGDYDQLRFSTFPNSSYVSWCWLSSSSTTRHDTRSVYHHLSLIRTVIDCQCLSVCLSVCLWDWVTWRDVTWGLVSRCPTSMSRSHCSVDPFV